MRKLKYGFAAFVLISLAVFAAPSAAYAGENATILKEAEHMLLADEEYKDGWYTDEYGITYYYEDGAPVCRQMRKIGGAYYYFDYSGQMIKDYDTELAGYENNRMYYVRAKKSGKLYCNEWYAAADGSWYYYGNDCYAVEGLVKVNGKLYYFDIYGKMYTDEILDTEAGLYDIDKDGIVSVVPDGWNNLYGNWYYVKDGTAVKGIQQINGEKYYFGYNGAMYSDSLVMDHSMSTLYIAGRGGELVAMNTPGWHLYDGEWFYINSDGTVANGIMNIDSEWYSFNDYGRCMTSVFDKCEDGIYYYDKDGKRVSDKWVHIEDKYYYATESGILATGDTKIGGKWYTFDQNGLMLTGIVEASDKKLYYYKQDGSYWGEIKSTGWQYKGNSWYYISDEGMYKDGAYVLPDGNIYAFKEDGRMYRSQFCDVILYITDAEGNTYKRNERLYVDSSGKAAEGWFKLNGFTYYSDSWSSGIARGFRTIYGKEYLFDDNGRMITGTYDIEGFRYYIDDSGVITGEEIIDGWFYNGGDVYYCKKGYPYTGWVGDYYVEDGLMYKDTVVMTDKGCYLLDEYGRWVSKKGWKKTSYGYYYINANGKLARNSWIKENGKWYYLKSDGLMCENETVRIKDKYEVFGEDGVWKYTLESSGKTRWVKKNDKWYYYQNGYLVEGVAYIDGRYYYFDKLTHEMQTDTVIDFMYYDKDGVRQSYTGWRKINDYWCYFDSASNMVCGWINDRGKSYYLDLKYIDNYGYIYAALTNVKTILGNDTALYTFDKDGACVETEYGTKGWVYMSGYGELSWAYIRDGEPVTGIAEIDNRFYLFDRHGHLCCNMSEYVYGKNDKYDLYYADENGVVVTKEGWYKDMYGYDIYVDRQGYAIRGIVNWKGKDYISF